MTRASLSRRSLLALLGAAPLAAPAALRAASAPVPAGADVRAAGLAALVVAGAALLASAGLCGFLSGTSGVAHMPPAVRSSRWVAPVAATPASLAAARRVWGEIRARYRLKDLRVPA